ncbi:MAG: TadE family protein [Verrucomicrobiota bacterium]
MIVRTKHRRQQKSIGQTIVEFALCIPIFLFMCMALVDLGMYVFVEATMGHVVRSAARYGITGQTGMSSTGDWGDAVLQEAIKHNPYDPYITVTKTSSSTANGFYVRVWNDDDDDGADDGDGEEWPSTFPDDSRVRFSWTQEFKYFTPFLKLLEGPNNQITIKVETIYTTEK